MNRRRFFSIVTDQRGVALPMAMLTLLILSALIMGFSVLSSSEPNIANNQLRVAQARALAEAGLERAIWALNNPTLPNGLADPLPGPVPAPYNASQLLLMSVNATTIGGFRVTVANGAVANERAITVTGWSPNDTASSKAKQRVVATLTNMWRNPPAALSVRGELQISGNTKVDSRADGSCGDKQGTWSTAATNTGGAGAVWGRDGNLNKNERGPAADIYDSVPAPTFDQYIYSDQDMAMLKALAQANGTYYQGAVTFNSSNRMRDGLIFVDSYSGDPVTATSPAADMAQVQIEGGAPFSTTGIFQGWLIVNGSLQISGDFKMQGFVYVQNDMTYSATGTGWIRGAVISRNIQDTVATVIDTSLNGNADIIFDCNAVRDEGPKWLIKAGTYKEVSG